MWLNICLCKCVITHILSTVDVFIVVFYRIMGQLFHECENHIKDDHLLLRLLVFLSSEDDIDIMLNNVPVHIVALHVADLWQTIDKVKKVTRYT